MLPNCTLAATFCFSYLHFMDEFYTGMFALSVGFSRFSPLFRQHKLQIGWWRRGRGSTFLSHNFAVCFLCFPSLIYACQHQQRRKRLFAYSIFSFCWVSSGSLVESLEMQNLRLKELGVVI